MGPGTWRLSSGIRFPACLLVRVVDLTFLCMLLFLLLFCIVCVFVLALFSSLVLQSEARRP